MREPRSDNSTGDTGSGRGAPSHAPLLLTHSSGPGLASVDASHTTTCSFCNASPKTSWKAPTTARPTASSSNAAPVASATDVMPAPATPPGAHSERIQRPDEHLLQTIYVRFRPVTVRPQPENGVSHQLARPVVGHGAAPVRAQHWNPVDHPPCPPLTDMRRAGGASQCIDRKMLREQQGVADRVLHTRLVQSHLEARSFLIVSQAEIKQVADHLVTGRLSWIFSWVDLRTTDRVTVGDVDPSLSSACQRSDML